MNKFNELNKNKRIDWEYDTSNMNFVKASDLEKGKEYNVHGVFITKSDEYGKGACIILDDCIFSAPQRYVDVIQTILNDDEMIDTIKKSLVSIKISSFTSKKYHRKGYSIEWIEK